MKNLYLFLILICFEVSCTGQNQKAGEKLMESYRYIFENDTITPHAPRSRYRSNEGLLVLRL
jgi:hypothetical protein